MVAIIFHSHSMKLVLKYGLQEIESPIYIKLRDDFAGLTSSSRTTSDVNINLIFAISTQKDKNYQI